MNGFSFDAIAADYHWQLSLITLVSIFVVNFIAKKIAVALVPTLREARAANHEAYATKMQKASYAANQKWNRKWGVVFFAVIFGLIIPFCVTVEAQPWWRYLVDMFVILMVYDFFYYLAHRFLFHDEGFFGGPLLWVHAVHHRQHNPCRGDSSFIHPIEVALGLSLYVGTVFLLSRFMGDFHVVTIVITWIAFSEINLHNHDLWTADKFPFRYANTMAKMHHNHHARFTGGNFATISLFYDWLFGTLDYGDKPRKAGSVKRRRKAQVSPQNGAS
ncbi:sterol desaturase family protein [Stakelama tenebrarum]|uniref:Sterol desaturase family protein n=1 Tax=Stakelama tenebrarum TaxID=2711215 RepID=A0A6G6Y9M9_9SPHN|nr:sterol desaturase family protein [Sphingosinithalassobacter tenebrarum]QIG81551.1 sterol desaturase family protein [Sphingosinithalassobacter tenebrarum]